VSEENEKNEPRFGCAQFFRDKDKGIREQIELPKAEFDQLCTDKQFVEGPFLDSFGDGPHDIYNPHRQAFGVLQDGRAVYCEAV